MADGHAKGSRAWAFLTECFDEGPASYEERWWAYDVVVDLAVAMLAKAERISRREVQMQRRYVHAVVDLLDMLPSWQAFQLAPLDRDRLLEMARQVAPRTASKLGKRISKRQVEKRVSFVR